MAKKSQKSSVDFETSLQQLESIVENMEKGELSLEESLKDFEQGVKLTRLCQQALKDAEQKVSILMQDSDNGLEEFHPSAKSDSDGDT